MYYYIYAKNTLARRFDRLRDQIETEVTKLGIDGPMEKLTSLRTIQYLVEDAAKQGVDCLVIVGDDAALKEVIPLATVHNMILAHIPVGDQLEFARAFELPYGVAACTTIGRRLIKEIHLGIISGRSFLGDVVAERIKPGATLSMRVDNLWNATFDNDRVVISNIAAQTQSRQEGKTLFVQAYGRTGGAMSFFGGKKYDVTSSFAAKEIVINKSDYQLTCDGTPIGKPPATIEQSPVTLRMIVGKQKRARTL